MTKAYVIEKLWLDPSENHISNAMGYSVQGVVLDKEIAEKMIRDAPSVYGTGWPIRKGSHYKELRFTETNVL